MSAPSDGDLWDHEADVIVVGGGVAGFAAALAAADRGATVALLERGVQTGGTTAKSGGQFWIPNNRLMRDAGVADPRDPLLRLMARTAFPTLFDPKNETLGIGAPAFELIATCYDRSADALDRLVEMGAVFPVLDMHTPSYHADAEDDLAPYGRSLVPLGKPKNRADGTGGELLIRGMEKAAVERGVEILLEHRVAVVLRNSDGEVIGVEARVGRRTRLVRARRGVVFASGGFLHNREYAREYLRGPVFGGCAADTNTGDFVRIGIDLGAQFGNMNNAWWNQVVVEITLRTPSTIRDVWLPFGDSMIQVNRHGYRVVNEKMPYNERAQIHFHWDPTRREYPNHLMFMIFDQAVIDSPVETTFREPVPRAGESFNYVISGSTWDELVENIEGRLETMASRTGGVRLAPGFAENLRASVDRFDGFARAGKDADFGRGETPIQTAWGAAGRTSMPNPTMHPFATEGPYYCIILGGGSLDTKGGPRINTKAQVLDTAGDPIPGLFGAGNCIASPAGQAYWSPGGTIGPAMVFGFIAGESAAQEPVKKAD